MLGRGGRREREKETSYTGLSWPWYCHRQAPHELQLEGESTTLYTDQQDRWEIPPSVASMMTAHHSPWAGFYTFSLLAMVMRTFRMGIKPDTSLKLLLLTTWVWIARPCW